MIQDLYLTVQGYGQKFHQYDRNMSRSPGGTPEGTPEERNPHHKCLRIMLSKGVTEEGGRQSLRVQQNRGYSKARTIPPTRGTARAPRYERFEL